MGNRRPGRWATLAALAVLWAGTHAPDAAAQPAPAKANRLAKETSPYLLLHAHNPVDWYPWGPEAFQKAKAENKPVFLSVGYSACYWCHVMERESFMNPEIAKALNAGFVCVKVDREERPDVDQVYMTALQAFGRGGWPMSMFLTPDARPFFGGTYFPPGDREGMEGFGSILNRVSEAWRDHRAEIEADSVRLSELVRRSLSAPPKRPAGSLTFAAAAQGEAVLAGQFDAEFGGFGFNPENARRPKFPEPVNLVFLLDRHRRNPKSPKALAMTLTTLDHMARGGIRDQLAGGYHRYSTDRAWAVPHFEKMLYDNAQLASTHLLAFEQTGDSRWRAEAEATFAFVARSLTGPNGAFTSSLDAETAGEEGAYYVWTRDEVKGVLGDGPDLEFFAQTYGLMASPNFEKGRYVLLQPGPRPDPAAEARLSPLRAKLLDARDNRPAPGRDDKVLTSWNGLMIAAYADGFRLLKKPAYRAAAEKAADFLLATLRTADGRLLRTYRAGQAKLPAYLEDYAFLAHGLLRLYAATGDPKRLDQARALTDLMTADFADEAQGGFFSTGRNHETLLARPKDAADNVLPSGNSVAARNLVALAALTKEPRYFDAAGQAFAAFGEIITRSPDSVPLLLVGLQEYLDARPGGPPAGAATPNATPDVVSASAVYVPADGTKPDRFEVTLTIKEGWHVYANPSGVDGIPPTRLKLGPAAGATLDGVDYPAGVSKILAASGQEKVAVYEGTVALPARLTFDPSVTPAARARWAFRLEVQACNDRLCLAPATLEVSARPR